MSWAQISWQCIIAGAVTALAVSIILTLLGVALGFTVIKPTSDDPLHGLGLAFGIWSVVSIVVSLAAGGFVAGLFAGAWGSAHGFMVWALVLIIGTAFSGMAIGAAMRAVGTAVRGIGSGAATVVSSVGSGAASVASNVGHSISDLASTAVDHIQENLNLDFDSDHVREDVQNVLRDTGIETLQPEYLKRQMREARSDLRSAINRLRMNPSDYDQIINDFLTKQGNRLDTITGEVDRDAAVTALMNNRDISRQEAEETVDNAIAMYQQGVDRARQTLADAKQSVEEARVHLHQMADNARIKAEHISRGAAKSALLAAIALIIGAVICCYAGIWGSRMTARRTILFQERAVEINADRPDLRP